jgi:hypothetical protein
MRTLAAAELLRLALDIVCDPRTLRKELDKPGSVRGQVGDRIRQHIETAKYKRKNKKTRDT